MSIITDEKPEMKFENWVIEKSGATIKSITLAKTVLQRSETKLSDEDQEWFDGFLYSAIKNACSLLAFGAENLTGFTNEWVKRIDEGGEPELDNFLNHLGLGEFDGENSVHITYQKVLKVIELAELLYPSEEYKFPRLISSKQLAEQFISELESPNPHRRNLVEYLEDLSDNELAELMACMWIGRGENDPEDWLDVVRSARDNLGDAVMYMIEKIPLGTYLRAGGEKLRFVPDSPFTEQS